VGGKFYSTNCFSQQKPPEELAKYLHKKELVYCFCTCIPGRMLSYVLFGGNFLRERKKLRKNSYSVNNSLKGQSYEKVGEVRPWDASIEIH
jgi:hypothetical protein